MDFTSNDIQIECKVGDTGYTIPFSKQLVEEFERTVYSRLENSLCLYLRSEFPEVSCIEEIFKNYGIDEIKEAIIPAIMEEIDMYSGKL